MVEVQQGALGPLEQNVFAGSGRLVNRAGAVDHMGGEALAVIGVLLDHRIGVEGFDPIDLLQQFVLFGQRAAEAIPQPGGIEQVQHPDAVAFGFVGIGGADAAARGADAAIAAPLFHRLIKQAVVGHGHVGRGGQLQASYVDAVAQKHVQFPEHHLGVDHGSGTDQAGGVGVEDAGGNEVEFQHPVVDDDRVPGVHAALIADDDVSGTAEQIRDLSLPFVTPLRTDDDDVGQGHSGPKPLQSTT